jgi:hypothetical protein
MSKAEFLLKLSIEGRQWAELLLPIFSAGIFGWHLPQPSWVKKP